MNPTPSDSFTAHVFMEFEDDASAFASAEPGFVPTQATAAPPPSVAAAPATLEQWKAQLAALNPHKRAELACFLIQSLDQKEEYIKTVADPTASLEAVRQALAKVPGTPAQAVDAEREER